MSYKFVNMTILFLTLMIVGTVIAPPVDNSTKSTENPFIYTVLTSMIENSPANHSYRSAVLVHLQQISVEDDPLTANITMLLELDCGEEPLCPREICTILITQDESNNIIIDDQSKECHDVENTTIVNHVDERSKREATEVDIKDPIIQKFKDLVLPDYFNEYKNEGKPLFTRTVNATKEDIPDGTKYVIYYNIIEPWCIDDGPRKACSIDDFSPTRLCVINVEHKNNVTTTKAKITSSTCENRPLITDEL